VGSRYALPRKRLERCDIQLACLVLKEVDGACQLGGMLARSFQSRVDAQQGVSGPNTVAEANGPALAAGVIARGGGGGGGPPPPPPPHTHTHYRGRWSA
jgi:hypothetical protein